MQDLYSASHQLHINISQDNCYSHDDRDDYDNEDAYDNWYSHGDDNNNYNDDNVNQLIRLNKMRQVINYILIVRKGCLR